MYKTNQKTIMTMYKSESFRARLHLWYGLKKFDTSMPHMSDTHVLIKADRAFKSFVFVFKILLT